MHSFFFLFMYLLASLALAFPSPIDMAASPSTHSDSLNDPMELEKGFYDEGYKAGLEDGTQAGLIEGKLFGIEKGYEKALEMGKLRGRAMVWNSRLAEPSQSKSVAQVTKTDKHQLADVAASLPHFQENERLKKQVHSLSKTVNGEHMDMSNSDEAVAAFDDLMIKAWNKAKVVSNITGEALGIPSAYVANTGIEDARGLSARH
jgi:Essential protein Yae1, N terminal